MQKQHYVGKERDAEAIHGTSDTSDVDCDMLWEFTDFFCYILVKKYAPQPDKNKTNQWNVKVLTALTSSLCLGLDATLNLCGILAARKLVFLLGFEANTRG